MDDFVSTGGVEARLEMGECLAGKGKTGKNKEIQSSGTVHVMETASQLFWSRRRTRTVSTAEFVLHKVLKFLFSPLSRFYWCEKHRNTVQEAFFPLCLLFTARKKENTVLFRREK